MKKTLFLLISIIITVLMFVPSVTAATASASLSGPGTVRSGDSITLTFKGSGTNIYGWSGTLVYDSTQLTLISTKKIITDPWVFDFYSSNFTVDDTVSLSSPVTGSKDLFSITFKVKSLTTGSRINVSFVNVLCNQDIEKEIDLGTVSYSADIAAPLSTNNNLSSLNVSNADISPNFNKNTTAYTANVPFSVSKLDISAAAEDSKAKLSINNPNLISGGTTDVSVTVTAENGAKKVYTIKVSRPQDPNYIASDNCDLSALTVDGFLLSPVFDTAVTKYVVWLPYETDSLTVRGIAADAKASGVEIVGGTGMTAGSDNEIRVICTAENGATKEYIVIAKRAPSHGEEPDPTVSPTETPTTAPTEEVTASEAESTGGNDETPDVSGVPVWLTVILAVTTGLMGLAAGYFIKKGR